MGGPVHRVLFICHGNICRSTMAQSVMSDLVRRAGLEDGFRVGSAATSREEIGNPPHPGTVRKLRQEGVPLVPHRARQVRADELDYWDLICYMDAENLWGLRRIFGAAAADAAVREGKIAPLLPGRDVADPWYTGDFDATYRDVLEGCTRLLDSLQNS